MNELFTEAQEAAEAIMQSCRSNDFGKHWRMINFEHRAQRVPEGHVSFEAVNIQLDRADHGYRTYHADVRFDPPVNGKIKITYSFTVEHMMSDEWDGINREEINCLLENCLEQAAHARFRLFTWIREFDAKES
jgi:hypothetical protein